MINITSNSLYLASGQDRSWECGALYRIFLRNCFCLKTAKLFHIHGIVIKPTLSYLNLNYFEYLNENFKRSRTYCYKMILGISYSEVAYFITCVSCLCSKKKCKMGRMIMTGVKLVYDQLR